MEFWLTNQSLLRSQSFGCELLVLKKSIITAVMPQVMLDDREKMTEGTKFSGLGFALTLLGLGAVWMVFLTSSNQAALVRDSTIWGIGFGLVALALYNGVNYFRSLAQAYDEMKRPSPALENPGEGLDRLL